MGGGTTLRNYGNKMKRSAILKLAKCATESPPDQAKINQILENFCSRYISEQMTDTGVYLVTEREGRLGVNSYNQKVLRITKTVWTASH